MNVSTPTPPRPHRFDPRRLKYSTRWLGAGAALGALSLLALKRGGWPARLVWAAGLVGAWYSMFYEPRKPILEHVTLNLPQLPPELDGLRIGQLTDLHLGMPHSPLTARWAIEQMCREKPDLLVITGDFIDFDWAFDLLHTLLTPLQAPLGIYAIPGNHDYWESLPRLRNTLADLDITWLIDTNRRLTWKGRSFWIAGTDDQWEGNPDLDTALAHIPPEDFILLLAHEPDMVMESRKRGVDVQLSGHTHGGHLFLPWLGHFCLPRYGTEYPSGFAQLEATHLYVSRGLSGLPLRLGCPPEATIFTLRKAAL